MPTDALLTLLGLLVAVLVLMSPDRRQDLRARTTWIEWTVGIAPLLVVHSIRFSQMWEARSLPTLGPWRWGFDPDLASYAIVLTAGLFVSYRISSARLRPGRIGVFRPAMRDLTAFRAILS